MSCVGVNIDLKMWASLALDTCPDCGHHGLILRSQAELAAILTCPECHSKYWISPIRNRGAWKLNGIES